MIPPYHRRGPDPERERRHLGFLNLLGNPELLADGARAAYREEGRGFYALSDQQEAVEGMTPVTYVPLSKIDRLPDDEARRDLERMVRRYDPRTHLVVVVEEGGVLSAYRLRMVAPQSN